jgi:hypothetical protein
MINTGKIVLLFVTICLLGSCSRPKISEPVFTLIETNVDQPGSDLEITFLVGKSHNHPTFAFWIEDLEGRFIETLYITQYFGSGIFGRGSLGVGRWDTKPGRADRPSALPYWLHKRVNMEEKVMLPSPDNPVPDGITAATPKGNFVIKAKALKPLSQKFRLVMEINQPWDWNEYWNNSLHLGDFNYSVSCQPALIYAVTIDSSQKDVEYFLNPIGHSHFSGMNGKLYSDLSTITTAKEIVHKVSVKLK